MRCIVENLKLGDRAMRYSHFVPRLYNYCLSLGFERQRMMPSRAFCSDESQGYPVILLAQHFGTFPFDHGRVGGKVAINRHGPHSHHGEDLIIVQASHVGYDADTRRFGVYQRPRTAGREFGDSCGKMCAVLHWYQHEYQQARDHVLCGRIAGVPTVFIDNQFLDERRHEGLFLNMDRLVDHSDEPLRVQSTSKAFPAAAAFANSQPTEAWSDKPQPIGSRLTPEMFHFRRTPTEGLEGHDVLEAALGPAMPTLVTSSEPALDAARYHTQLEFDRTYRSILHEPAYRGKNLLFISGLNIDISPPEGLPFPLTKFIPWAAYVRLRDGRSFLLEQDELTETLRAQSLENADRMSFDAAIHKMTEADGVTFSPGL
jgi:hypothetical protein